MKKICTIYNRLGPSYDRDHLSPNTSAEYAEQRRMEQISLFFKNFKNSKVLDVACGTGNYLIMAKNNDAAMVVGSDISESMIKCCLEKEVPYSLIGDYHSLPFKDDTFDCVLCIDSIHYSEDPIKVISELKRVSVANSIILISYFNALNFRKTNSILKLFSDTPASLEHRYFPGQIENICKSLGLDLIYTSGINLLPFRVNSKERNKDLLNIFKIIEKKICKTKLNVFLNEMFIVAKNKTICDN